MIEVTVEEPEHDFDALLARAEAGEEIVVTRDGEAVAMLVPGANAGMDDVASCDDRPNP